MCGIAGIMRIGPFVSPEVAIPDRWLDALDAPIAARGPDGSGRWRTRSPGPDANITHVALLHRRMAILDISGGSQPMVTPALNDGTGEVAVTFNGCIYNHRALRTELAGLGHTFTTDHSDTETLLFGHRQWGRALHERLEGMYAAGIWDGADRSLVLMRDLAGEKPLYFAEIRATGKDGERETTGTVVFASSAAAAFAVLRAMQRDAESQNWSESQRAALNRELEIDPSTMRHWLAFGWGEGTPWVGIRELKPGQIAWFDSLGRTGRRRQSIEMEAKRSLPLDSASTWSLIQSSVEQRLEADVPLGCFLSGGLDSGLIAAAAQGALSKRGERLKTFTMRMPDAAYDESELAAATAAMLGTEHTTLNIEGDPAGRVGSDLKALIQWMGLPFGDSSLLPTYWLSRAVKDRVKVALSGDGGDELFAGYERHAVAPWLKRLRPMLRLAGVLPLSSGNPRTRAAKMARLCDAARHSGYADLVAIFPTRDMRRLVRSDAPSAAFSVPQAPHFRDLETYLPGDLLRKVDSASMRVALEVRAPLLDRDLIYRAAATPLHVLMRGGKRKGMLREAARGVLPDAVLSARKAGFAIPIGAWFRAPGPLRETLRESLLDAQSFADIGMEINMGHVERLLKEHDAGTRDHAQRLFGLLSIATWNQWRRSM